jgi:hypothetical protein
MYPYTRTWRLVPRHRPLSTWLLTPMHKRWSQPPKKGWILKQMGAKWRERESLLAVVLWKIKNKLVKLSSACGTLAHKSGQDLGKLVVCLPCLCAIVCIALSPLVEPKRVWSQPRCPRTDPHYPVIAVVQDWVFEAQCTPSSVSPRWCLSQDRPSPSIDL